MKPTRQPVLAQAIILFSNGVHFIAIDKQGKFISFAGNGIFIDFLALFDGIRTAICDSVVCNFAVACYFSILDVIQAIVGNVEFIPAYIRVIPADQAYVVIVPASIISADIHPDIFIIEGTIKQIIIYIFTIKIPHKLSILGFHRTLSGSASSEPVTVNIDQSLESGSSNSSVKNCFSLRNGWFFGRRHSRRFGWGFGGCGRLAR